MKILEREGEYGKEKDGEILDTELLEMEAFRIEVEGREALTSPKMKCEFFPPRPDDERDFKEERMYNPRLVALRDFDYVKKDHIKDPLRIRWKEYCTKYHERMLPVGSGSFFNGYYHIKRTDFYLRDRSNGVVSTLFPSLVPKWSDYADWYRIKARDAGLNDDRYDTDGNTLSVDSQEDVYDSSSDSELSDTCFSVPCDDYRVQCQACGERMRCECGFPTVIACNSMSNRVANKCGGNDVDDPSDNEVIGTLKPIRKKRRFVLSEDDPYEASGDDEACIFNKKTG